MHMAAVQWSTSALCATLLACVPRHAESLAAWCDGRVGATVLVHFTLIIHIVRRAIASSGPARRCLSALHVGKPAPGPGRTAIKDQLRRVRLRAALDE